MSTTPDSHALAGRSVLVTGAGGFIGSHLTARLVEEGARVRAFLRYNSRNERGWLDELDSSIQREIDAVLGDLRDVESVARAVRGTEVVFHLGAQIAIPYSYVNPRDFVEMNVGGTLNVATAARDAGVQRVVHTSTSEVYGSAQVVLISEDHRGGITDKVAQVREPALLIIGCPLVQLALDPEYPLGRRLRRQPDRNAGIHRRPSRLPDGRCKPAAVLRHVTGFPGLGLLRRLRPVPPPSADAAPCPRRAGSGTVPTFTVVRSTG